MKSLTKFTLPAERLRGCEFSQTFTSPTDIVNSGGVVSGTPTFSNNGVTLNGTTDSITYTLSEKELQSASFSSVIEFTPDFETDEDATRTIFDSTNSNRFYVVKGNSANGYNLLIGCGHASIANIAEATYSPYWKVGEKNILVVTSTSGDTDVWLNGTQILANASTAWTAKIPTDLTIGSRYDGANKFDGIIHSLKVFNIKLTDQEALDYSNNATFAYENKAIINLPMGMAEHAKTNTQDTEICNDGTMEAVGTASWNNMANTTIAKTATAPYSGTQCMQCTADTTTGRGGIYQNITGGTAGKTYYCEAWFKAGTGATGQTCKIEMYDATTGYQVVANSTLTASWQKLSGMAVAGNNTVSFRITASLANAGDIVFLDEVKYREVKPQTLDRSRNGLNATFGDGITSTTYPTKLTDSAGYDFDGGDYLKASINNGELNQSALSFVMEFTPDFAVSENVNRFLFETTDNSHSIYKGNNALSNVLRISLGVTLIDSVSSATLTLYWKQYQKNQLVIISKSGDTSVWLNGNIITANDTTAWSATNPTSINIGSRIDATLPFSGKIHRFEIYPFFGTPIFAEDGRLRLIRKTNSN